MHISLIFSTFAYMNTRDNIQAELQILRMENVRLTNELAKRNEYARFLEDENKAVESEIRREYEAKLALVEMERDNALEKVKEAGTEIQAVNVRCDKERMRADNAEQMLGEVRKALAESKERVTALTKKVKEVDDLKDVAEAADKAVLDAKQVIELINRRVFQRNSDATRFLNGEIDPNCPLLMENGLADIVKHVMAVTSGKERKDAVNPADKKSRNSKVRVPNKKAVKSDSSSTEPKAPRRRRVYTATILEELGIDTSNLPKGSKLITRKDKETGEDTWYIQLFFHTPAKVTCREYKIGRFNVPKSDPMCSKRPVRILAGNPIMPSFARFYLESKFSYNLSENRILEMLKGMKTNIPQSSLNFWMHQIMEMLREKLEPLMLEAIRQSKFTNNDGTRLLVRSRETPDDPLKYTIEYVQAALSLEKKLCVMLYDEGTRDHKLQEEKIFKDSSIEGFVADRAPQYPAIVKDLEGRELLRQACWFHARHYLVDAYLVDSRIEMLLILINALFYIERVFLQEDDQSPEHRLEFRKEWSEPIVDRIMEMLKKMRAAGDEYGQMVHRAIDYILDDEEAFRVFLSDGRIDMHNIAIERCFRHIAMGRRNWLHTGSHFAAQNIAFMFGLLESCKLNSVNFGEYIEDILTRILMGEEVDASFLPCDYVRHFEDGRDAEVTKVSQAVA